ncbi:MAG: winged helix-turn-helix domain-containing protein [Rubritepida sp.]|jgi:TolB-like protein|nr:winged helix-turn-helix domain-containing protein [Rubritepida sp.]
MRGPGTERFIGSARFDAARGLLRAPGGRETALRPKTFALLELLLAEAGRVVTRAEILDAVWPGVFVTDDSITQCVVELRQALGPEAARLKTVPKRGYLLELPGGPPAPAAAGRTEGPPVVALLPFRLGAPDPALALFAEGVLEGVVGALAQLREPVVISANSTRRFADAAEDLAAIGARLGAQYLALGSLRRTTAGLRLAMELTEAASGVVLWRRAYDLPEAISIATEDTVAATIAHTLAPRVQEAELRQAMRHAPGDLAAYHLLLEARRLVFRLDRESFEQAGGMLRRAIELDPAFAPAHANLADWFSLRVWQGWSPAPAEDARSLEEAAERALALDAGQARALAILGHNNTILGRRYEAARALFDRALEAAPNDSDAWMWSAPTHAFLGDAEAAEARAGRAIALSPEDPLIFRHQHFMAIAKHSRGDWAAAAEWGLKSAGSNPHYTSNLRLLAGSLAALGRADEAALYAREVLRIEPGFRVTPLVERHPYRAPEARARYGRQLIEAGLPA